jgi:hypothetical protein
MAITLTSQISASVVWTLSSTPAGYSAAIPATNTFSYNSGQLANGTGAAGTANLIYASQLTIAASGNATVNLNGTPTTDPFGNNIVMARLKYLYANLLTAAQAAVTTVATSVALGNATNPVNLFSAATSTVTIRTGGLFLMGDSGATGIPITGGASDTLKILNNDGSNSAYVQLCAIGSSA